MIQTDGTVTLRRALISVSDRTGLAELVKFLADCGISLTATGGTGDFLRAEGLPVEGLESVSSFRELLGGRVKSLHPAVHAAILADRNDASHAADLAVLGTKPFDLVVGGLYPFEAISDGTWSAEAREAVDIGGPAMIRAAAKNHRWVTVVTDPADYSELISELRTGQGAVSAGFRRRMAASVFRRTAEYDDAIAATLECGHRFPEREFLGMRRALTLRYGENPDQRAAFYAARPPTGLAAAEQLAGPGLGYNNLVDADAARALVSEFSPETDAACAIIKHGAPCGAARAATLAKAFEGARTTDPVSAFGGVIGLNRRLDAETAKLIAANFCELIIAPGADPEAAEIIKDNKRIRLVTAPLAPASGRRMEVRSVDGGILAQERNPAETGSGGWDVVTEARPDAEGWRDLEFAWIVAKHAKSNAVVVAGGGRALGIGSGRTSRVDAAQAAVAPLGAASFTDIKPVAASDGFFPFADGITALGIKGVWAVAQPGGSKNDRAVIAEADRLGMAMTFTGSRRFRH